MFKRVVCIIMCLVLAMGMVACGGDSTADVSSKQSVSSSQSKTSSKNDESKTPSLNNSTPVSSTETVSKEPEKPAVKIMPLGDSLTQGGQRNVSAYRGFLSEMLKEGGYNTKFVGSHDWSKESIVDDNVMHSGYGGATIFTLNKLLGESKDANPDIILLMIGRNDMTDGTNPTNFVLFLDKFIIEELYKMFPDVHIFLASIPVIRSQTSEELDMKADTSYAPKIEEYVQQKKSSGAKMDFVDMRVSVTGLTAADFTADDFVHPTAEGYEKIAKQWYASITGKITEIAEAKAAA